MISLPSGLHSSKDASDIVLRTGNSNMNVDMRPSQSKGDAKGDGESYSTLRMGDLGLIVP